jgi:hypothetical protein
VDAKTGAFKAKIVIDFNAVAFSERVPRAHPGRKTGEDAGRSDDRNRRPASEGD